MLCYIKIQYFFGTSFLILLFKSDVFNSQKSKYNLNLTENAKGIIQFSLQSSLSTNHSLFFGPRLIYLCPNSQHRSVPNMHTKSKTYMHLTGSNISCQKIEEKFFSESKVYVTHRIHQVLLEDMREIYFRKEGVSCLQKPVIDARGYGIKIFQNLKCTRFSLHQY